MSIIITNISEQYNKEYGKGVQVYVLCINNNQLVEFEHNFEDGLAICLRKAAAAFEEMEKEGGLPLWEIQKRAELLKVLMEEFSEKIHT